MEKNYHNKILHIDHKISQFPECKNEKKKKSLGFEAVIEHNIVLECNF